MRLRSQAGKSAAHDVGAVARAAADPVSARLIDSGELGADDLDRIADYQARTGSTFAEAAVELGLLAPEAAGRALAEQGRGGLGDGDLTGVSRAVVAAFDPLDPLTLKLRALRSTLFQPDEMRGGETRVIVMAGVGTQDTPGIAANLAVLTAQLGFKGLLVDANFAAPTQHALFGLGNAEGATSLLTGGAVEDAAVTATLVPNLDLLPAGPEIATLSEAAERVALVARLRAMRHGHRFAIVDAGEQPPELLAALARGSDGVLLVVERRRTPFEAVRSVLARLGDNEVPVLGTVLAR